MARICSDERDLGMDRWTGVVDQIRLYVPLAWRGSHGCVYDHGCDYGREDDAGAGESVVFYELYPHFD